VSGSELPPTVKWTTTTGAEFLELPLGLPASIMQHYQQSTPLVVQTEYTGSNQCGTVRCHPGYCEGAPWYDWVEVAGHKGHANIVPFKVLAVVPLQDPGTEVTLYELIGVPGTTRTERDSALFTEWNIDLKTSV
jgi:hypothetical protein